MIDRELVIFDCDGVLIDSEPLAVEIELEMFDELGWALGRDEVIERFMGRSAADQRAEIEAWLGGPLPEGWSARWDARFRRKLAAELRPIPGIVDALDQITLRTCVASSSGHGYLEYSLGLVGLHERFAGRIFSASEVTNGKPAPDLFLHAASRMGAAPASCVVVEDSRYGVQAARAAGMPVLAYAGGGMIPEEQLAGAGTTIFHQMRDLPGLLARHSEA
jgi:HAD superfamily hydrolase (TIGR01509 family)